MRAIKHSAILSRLPWLEREFGWSDQTARRYIQVAEASKFNNLENLSFDVSGLYLLVAPNTPGEVIDAVAERSDAGERYRDLIDQGSMKIRPFSLVAASRPCRLIR
jgi:hypothetical protein